MHAKSLQSVWHHRLNGHEFEQALGDGEGQGSPACCSPRGCKELDTTEQQQHVQLEKVSVYKIISHSKLRFLIFLRQGGTLGNCVHVNCGL